MTDDHDPTDPAAVDLDATVVSTSRTFDEPTPRVGALIVIQGHEIGRHFLLRRKRVVLGRGATADLKLRHKQISREHARIETTRVGNEMLYRLVDLGSTNHVFVNGKQVEHHMLREGDKVHLGEFVLKFELLDAIDSKFHTEIRNRISYDDLTGLLTFESFRTALEWELDRFASSAKGCSVVMMDLDDFKKLNDTYGHLAGSFVLREVGRIIRTNIRQFDVAARYGGEEFIAYLPETEIDEAWIAADRLREVLGAHLFEHDGATIRTSISMGISHFPDDGRQLPTLIRLADERLYRAKRDGKDRVLGPESEGASPETPE